MKYTLKKLSAECLRISRLLMAFMAMAVAVAGSQNVRADSIMKNGDEEFFDPTPPPEPNVPDEEQTIYLVANPTGAGYFYHGSTLTGKPGSVLDLYAYENSGWRFQNWTINGKVVSTESTFSYKIPDNGETLVANYLYDPDAPNEPDVQEVRHPVALRSIPDRMCSFSPSGTISVKEGERITVYAYPHDGFEIRRWTVNGTPIDDVSNSITLTMDKSALQVVAELDYSPDPPVDPAANFFDPSSGEMIIDYFSTGNLYSTAGEKCDYNFDKIVSLTVKGNINNYDLGSISNFKNAEIIDLSRTSGFNAVESWNFSRMNMSSLSLPECVTYLDGYIFSECDNLSSLIIHALTPPECNDKTFEQFPNKEGLTVYVPTESLALYQDAKAWKDFMILPITSDTHALEVSLPENCTDGRYLNCSIELLNLRSGVRQKYLVSDRLVYVFNSLMKDESYEVYLMSRSGKELGTIKGITMGDEDQSVYFENLSVLGKSVARVLTSDGKDVTPLATIDWFIENPDGSTTYLVRGVSADDIAEGDNLVCRVSLGESLGTVYSEPDDKKVIAAGDVTEAEIRLEGFSTITMSGRVRDDNGNNLSGASVAAMQTLNGKYHRTYTTHTGLDGKWSLDVSGVPDTRISYSSQEYVTQNDTVSAAEDATLIDLGEINLHSISGARIFYGFTFKAAGKDVQDYYDDYQNVAFSVRNKTQNRDYNELSTQYPILVILEDGVNPGDELEITATSRTGAFSPVTAILTLDDSLRGEATFDILGHGGIKASYESSANRSVSGMIYDEKGELVRKGIFSGNSLNINGLDNSLYTLVAMGESAMMNSIMRLEGFDEAGLEKGVDYSHVPLSVTPGEITNVSLGEIPVLDEGKFSYMSPDGTALNFNKSTVTTGNYLTLSAKADFKPAYKPSVKNVALVIDLPENCEIVENSVIQGANLLPYTFDKGRLTIQVGDSYASQVRFCVMPTRGGELTVMSSVSFDYDDNRLTQPAGTATATVKDLEIRVPKTIASDEFTVTGSAPGRSEINIYENGELLGNGKADASGSYSIKCRLSDPYNLSIHKIYGEINTQTGTKLLSETKDIQYDINALEVSKVTMYHWNPEMHTTYEAEFDFQNPSTVPAQWTVYYPDKKFTYTVEFTANDTTRISNVVLYVHTANNKVVPLHPVFDKKKSLWVADIDMGNSNDGYYPVNVSVDFDAQTDALLDTQEISYFANLLEAFKKYQSEEIDDSNLWNQLYDAVDKYGIGSPEVVSLSNNIAAYYGYDLTDSWNLSFDEYMTLIESSAVPEISDNIADIMDMKIQDVEGLENITIESCSNVNESLLIEQGYICYPSYDGKKIYFLIGNAAFRIIDFENDIQITIDIASTSAHKVSKPGSDVVKAIHEAIATLDDACTEIEKSFEELLDNLSNYIGNAMSFWDSSLSYNVNELEKAHKVALHSAINGGGASADPQFKQSLKQLGQTSAELKKAKGIKAFISGPLAKVTGVGSAIIDLRNGIKTLRIILGIYNAIPEECPDDRAKWSTICNDTSAEASFQIGYYIAKIAVNLAIISDVGASVVAMVPSGGGSLVTLLVGIAAMGINYGIDKVHDKLFQQQVAYLKKCIRELKCIKDCGEPGKPECPKDPFEDEKGNEKDGNNGGGAYLSGCPNNNVKIDPSGFVYEAVPSNRIIGVKASIFYKETKEDMYGDPYEEVVLWNAEEYAQKNPLFTDDNGMYRWDVPQGMWQVKFEKDGYETTRSEWLPVPPPQLEVNIPIVQNSQPEVADARAYETGVEVTFSKYMEPSTLNASNIYVTASGEKVKGKVEAMDSETSDPFAEDGIVSNAPSYVSRVRFIPETPLSIAQGEIRLIINRNVLSYSGVPMAAAYSQVLDIEKEVTDIVADDVEVLYGSETDVTVHVVPFDAATGKTLHVESSSPMIASISVSDFTIDDDGKCTVRVKGELPGKASLLFSMNGVNASGETTINVVSKLTGIPVPEASRASGSVLYSGTEVVLTTKANNSIIYYTLDGSCPCDENGSRQVYTSPIVIDRDIEILAMTLTDDEASDVVGFSYTIKKTSMRHNLNEGWNWVSTTIVDDNATSWINNNGISIVRSGNDEAVKDAEGNFADNVGAMSSALSYKVKSSASTQVSRIGTAVNPGQPIAVKPGWNRLGYTSDQAMTLDEAFATTNVKPLDVVAGQNGFAQYDGNIWIGTLARLTPGEGYAYISQDNKNIIYNTAVVSKNVSRYAPGQCVASEFTVDENRYPDIMCVIAELHDEYDYPIDAESTQLLAFCGSECRGVATVIDGIAFMTVYGNTGDNITFKTVVSDKETKGQTVTMTETLLGDMNEPYVIVLDGGSGVNSIKCHENVSVRIDKKWLYIDGLNCDDIENVSVYDINGRKIRQSIDVPEEGIALVDIPEGAYVVEVETVKGFSYHKVIVH